MNGTQWAIAPANAVMRPQPDRAAAARHYAAQVEIANVTAQRDRAQALLVRVMQACVDEPHISPELFEAIAATLIEDKAISVVPV